MLLTTLRWILGDQPRETRPHNNKPRLLARRRKSNRIKSIVKGMTLLASTLEHSQSLCLKSDLEFHHKVKKHRRAKGVLDTSLLQPGDRAVLLSHRLPSQNDTFCFLTDNNPNVHNAVLDTGASLTVVNSFDLIKKGTLRRLSNPIPLVGLSLIHI